MKPRYLIYALLIGSLTVVSACAQDYIDFLPDEVKAPFQQKWQKIGENLSNTRDEWEGEYSRDVGTTYTHLLRWDKQNGFAVFQETCSYGPRAWVNMGSVVATTDDSILFIPVRNDGAPFRLATPSGEYVRVKWGKQHWLVSKKELRLFAYVINSGSAFDLGNFYLRVQDRENERTGLPELPKEFMAIFEMKPIKAKVVGVGDGQYIWNRKITIDAGSEQKVIKGMTFFLEGKGDTIVTAIVTDVSPKTSVILLTQIVNRDDADSEAGSLLDDADKESFEPKPGLIFSSKMPASYADQLVQ
jgi:hypothetical protein